MALQRDIDILEIPLEGVAAYWLSLKKLLEGKRNFKPLAEEAEYTTEPYIKHLLNTAFTGLDETRVRRLADVRRKLLLEELALKLDLMRMALLDIASGENPRKTLAKMTAKFANPSTTEEQAFAMVQQLMDDAPKAAEHVRSYNVDHKTKPAPLMVMLLFYALWGRKEGKMALQSFLEFITSAYFRDGLALVIDGFDTPFIRKRLQVHKDTILSDVRLKMELSEEMCVAMKQKLAYEEVFLVAQTYLV